MVDVSLYDLCNLDNKIINHGYLKLSQDDSIPETCSGIYNSIINTSMVDGSFFGTGLNSGLVKINSSVDKYKIPDAFLMQKGGYIEVDNISGKNILGNKSAGIFEGHIVKSDNFGKDMTGGISKVYSIHGDEPFKNMAGGIVWVKNCHGLHPFQDMSSGIAFVQEFRNKSENLIGKHNGGTIITTGNSMTGDSVFDKSLYDETVVFRGSNASQKLNSFSDYILNQSPEWLVETYNKTILDCNFENLERFSDYLGDTVFNETLDWTVPVHLGKDDSGKKTIKELLIKLNDLFGSINSLVFYEKRIDTPSIKKYNIGSIMDNIYNSAKKLRDSADKPLLETGYRGELKVDNLTNEDISEILFKTNMAKQQTLLGY